MLTANLGNTDIATVTNGGALQKPGGMSTERRGSEKFNKLEIRLKDFFKKLPRMMKSKIKINHLDVNLTPSQGQKEAGNYKKAHIKIHGLDITIENPKGSFRSGIDKTGKEWKSKLHSHYGYIKGTTGRDGDHVDCFIGPNSKSEIVYVVNQINPETERFDEHKAMIGYNSENDAEEAYIENYHTGWQGLDEIIPMTISQFKDWLNKSDTTKKAKELFHKSSSVAGIGEVHTWSDGSKHRKTAIGWVLVSEGKNSGSNTSSQATQKKDEKSGNIDQKAVYEKKAVEALGRWKEFEEEAKKKARERIAKTPPEKRAQMFDIKNAEPGDIVRVERPIDGRVNRGHLAKVLDKVEGHLKVMLPSGSIFLFLAADLAFAKSNREIKISPDGTIPFLKGKKGNVGEIRTWADGNKYKKVREGAWQMVGESDTKGAHQADLEEYTKKTGGDRSEHRASVEKAMQNNAKIPVKVMREYPSLLDKFPEYKKRVLAIDSIKARKEHKEVKTNQNIINPNPAIKAVESLKSGNGSKKESQIKRLADTLRTLNFGKTPKGFPQKTYDKLWNLDSKLGELKSKVYNLKKKSLPQSLRKVGKDKERKEFSVNKNKKLKEFQNKIGELLRKGRGLKKEGLSDTSSGFKSGQKIAIDAINSLKSLKHGELPNKQATGVIDAIGELKKSQSKELKAKMKIAEAEVKMDKMPELKPNPTGMWEDSMNGLPNETWELHFDGDPQKGGKPKPERQKLHDFIKGKSLDHVEPVNVNQQPFALLLMGGPASGKSSIMKNMGINSTEFVFADADEIKERLPEYRVGVKNRIRKAAAMAHEESSYIVKSIREQAMEDRKNLVIDAVGSNPESYLNNIAKLRKQGYRIHLVMADCPLEVALPRAIERSEVTGRYIPENYMKDAYPKIPDSFKTVSHECDEAIVVSTNIKPYEIPPILYKKSDGQANVNDIKWSK
ncbi:MAG: zeta toxin family protein [Leptospiraceae bacterium]|nr:zeta toxin family protein [Leptospiraceae bacterium]